MDYFTEKLGPRLNDIRYGLMEKGIEIELVSDLMQLRTRFTIVCLGCGAEHMATFKDCISLTKEVADHMLAAINEFMDSTCTCNRGERPSVDLGRVIR